MLRLARRRVHGHWEALCLIFHFTFASSFVKLMSNHSKIQEFLDWETNTTDQLLKDYDKRFIPALSGNPLKVNVEIEVFKVLKLDDREMESEMILYIRQVWYDYRLSWNSNYSNRIKVREHLLDKIWMPDVRIRNLKDMKRFDGFGGINMNIHPDGRIYYSQLVLVKISCPMDLHDFPMDEQRCFLNFSSFAYAKSLLTYSLFRKKVDVKPVHLPQFEFVKAKELAVKNETIVPRISIALIFQRRSGYYILQIYVPSIFLVVLSWLAFVMESSDIANRLALEITMVLSIVFLHGGINTSLPHVSYAKASDWFVIVSFTFIFMALLETMLVYRISSLKVSGKNRYIQLTSFMRCSLFLSPESRRNQMTQDDHREKTTRADEATSLENKNVPLTGETSTTKPWNVADFVDKICIVAFPVLYIGFNIFYWLYYM